MNEIISILENDFNDAQEKLEVVLDYYENVAGIITSPGKFEGEPVYVPFFWEYMMDGGEDEFYEYNGHTISVFKINSIDTKFFPGLSEYSEVHIWEDDLGFANHQLIKE